jgi:6,7-dimethyl-8-ribityllumazine synthase
MSWPSRVLPVTNAILTVDNMEQAFDRAGGKLGNKGADAAMAALEMAQLLSEVDGQGKSVRVAS